MTKHHAPRAHDHPGFDTPPTNQAPPPLPFASLDDAVLAGDFVTADAYYQHENRTVEWLDSYIAGKRAVKSDPTSSSPFQNNPAAEAAAHKLATALEAYKAHRG